MTDAGGNGSGRVLACREHRHHTYRAVARCLLPAAAWIDGEGAWGSLAHCDGRLTVQLHKERAEAENSLREIDATGCGGGCERAHEMVYIEREAAPGGVSGPTPTDAGQHRRDA